MTKEGIKNIILEQDEVNSKILKDDVVVIIEQIISGKKITEQSSKIFSILIKLTVFHIDISGNTNNEVQFENK